MPGLDNDELLSLLESRTPAAAPETPSTGNQTFDRADAIRREIYQRHGLSPDLPLEQAIEQIKSSAAGKGVAKAGWPNREAFEQARVAYAKEMNGLVPRSPAEVKQRYADSIHLLDPHTQQYMQRFGRDVDFLQSEAAMAQAYPDRRVADATAIRYYDESKDGRLARKGAYGNPFSVTSGGFQSMGGWGARAKDALFNTQTPTGEFTTVNATLPNALKISWGDSGHKAPPTAGAFAPVWSLARALTDGEAWKRARGINALNRRSLTSTDTPVADLPSNASGAEVAARIAELRNQTLAAMPAEHTERNYRHFGYAPPGVIADTFNNLPDYLDLTALIPAGQLLAGAGKGVAGAVGRDMAKDMLTDQATNAGVSAGFGGESGRSWNQYWLGGGKPGVDFTYRSPEEVEAAKQAGRELWADKRKDEGVSAAQREAYKSLEESGALGPLARERARMFPTRQQ